MNTGFDPYQQWLGIPAAEQPPNHYRLLGLSLFESRPEAVEAAYQQAVARVQPHVRGPAAVAGQAIMQQLLLARQTLLNPAQKQPYDSWLRSLGYAPTQHAPQTAAPSRSEPAVTGSTGYKRPAPRPRDPEPSGTPGIVPAPAAGYAMPIPVSASTSVQPAAGPNMAAPGSVKVVDGAAGAAPATVAAASTAADYRHERSNFIPLLAMLTGACVLLGAGIVVVALMGRMREPHAPSDGTRRVVVTNPQAEQSQPERERPPREKPPQRETSPVAVVPKPITERPEFPESATDTTLDDAVAGRTGGPAVVDPPTTVPPMEANPAAVETVTRPARFAALRRTLAIPRVAQAIDKPASLGKIDLPEGEHLALRFASGETAGGYRIEPTAEPEQWEVFSTGDTAPLGRFQMAAGELQYSWLSAADPTADSRLRNLTVELEAGGEKKSLPLREPQMVEPLTARPLSGGSVVSLRVEDLPSASALGLEIIDLQGAFPRYEFPEGNQAEISKATYAVLHGVNNDPLLSFRISFSRPQNDTLVLEARPLLEAGGRRAPFVPAPLATELTQLEAQVTVADTTIRDLRRRYRRMPTELAAAEAAYKTQMQPIEQRVALLKELSEVSKQVQDDGVIHFRLFARMETGEVNLIVTKEPEAAGESSPSESMPAETSPAEPAPPAGVEPAPADAADTAPAEPAPNAEPNPEPES